MTLLVLTHRQALMAIAFVKSKANKIIFIDCHFYKISYMLCSGFYLCQDMVFCRDWCRDSFTADWPLARTPLRLFVHASGFRLLAILPIAGDQAYLR